MLDKIENNDDIIRVLYNKYIIFVQERDYLNKRIKDKMNEMSLI